MPGTDSGRDYDCPIPVRSSSLLCILDWFPLRGGGPGLSAGTWSFNSLLAVHRAISEGQISRIQSSKAPLHLRCLCSNLIGSQAWRTLAFPRSNEPKGCSVLNLSHIHPFPCVYMFGYVHTCTVPIQECPCACGARSKYQVSSSTTSYFTS